MNQIKVSIVLPSYNVVDYIRGCIESVAKQSLKDIEIICIDAESDDGTIEILEEYAAHDKRIRIIKSGKKSYGYQMNLGIREAQGKYVGIVETDDYIEPTMFEVLFAEAIKSNADVVKALHCCLFELKNGSELRLPVDYIPVEINTGIPFSPDSRNDVHRWDGNIWNGIYRKDFLIENQIKFLETPGAAYQDIGFSQQVLNKARLVEYLRVHLYNYRIFRRGASILSLDCLHNLRIEYEWLFDNARMKINCLTYVYLRMLQSFFIELEKVAFTMGFDETQIPYAEDMDWFRNKLLTVLRDNPSLIDKLDVRNKENLKLFMGNTSRWFDKQKYRMELVSLWYHNFQIRIGGSELVIFGAGNYGKIVLMFLLKNGIAPVAFADNDNMLQGRTIYGIPVIYADEAVAWHKDAFFVIANRKSPYDIKNQLIRKDIDERQIEIFDGNNADLTEGIRRVNIPIPCSDNILGEAT